MLCQVGIVGMKGVGALGDIAIDNLQISAGSCPGDDISYMSGIIIDTYF